jgi:hypothetical protein
MCFVNPSAKDATDVATARVEGADGTKTHHRFGGRQEDLQDGSGVGHVVASKICGDSAFLDRFYLMGISYIYHISYIIYHIYIYIYGYIYIPYIYMIYIYIIIYHIYISYIYMYGYISYIIWR